MEGMDQRLSGDTLADFHTAQLIRKEMRIEYDAAIGD